MRYCDKPDKWIKIDPGTSSTRVYGRDSTTNQWGKGEWDSKSTVSLSNLYRDVLGIRAGLFY